MSKQRSKKQNLKPEQEDPAQNIIPIFRIKVLNKTSIISRYVGCAKKDDKICDESIEFEKELQTSDKDGKLSLDLGQCGKYDLSIRACQCNIVGDYLIKNDKYPAYYCTVLYSNKFVGGYLMTMFLNFTLSKETLKEVSNESKKYVNRQLGGTFTFELKADDVFLSYLLECKTPEIEQELMEKYASEFETRDETGKTQLMEQISKELEDRLDEYRKLFEPQPVDFIPTQKKVVEHMVTFFRTHKLMPDLLRFSVKKKDKDRIDEKCPDQSYEPPKRKYNIKELKENPELIDKMIDNLSDQDSD